MFMILLLAYLFIPLMLFGLVPDKWPQWVKFAGMVVLAAVIAVGIKLFAGLVWAIGEFVWTSGILLAFELWLGKPGGRINDTKGYQKWLAEAATHGPLWQQDVLERIARETFERYNADLTSANFASMQTYMTPDMVEQTRALIGIMRQAGHHVVWQNLTVLNTYSLNQSGYTNEDWPTYQTWDKLAMVITVQGNGAVIQDATGQELRSGIPGYTFIFLFEQMEGRWVLSDVVNRNELSFGYAFEHTTAAKYGLHFLDDVSLYASPKQGLLFGNQTNVSMRPSIYECYAGWMNNRLIQMYYLEWPDGAKEKGNYYVGEIQIPHSVDGVIISSKKRPFTPAGYQRVTVEWPEFNQRYDLFARNNTGADVFEVLQPDVMTTLYDIESEASIEISGNFLYVYYPRLEESYGANGYDRMVKILNALAARI